MRWIAVLLTALLAIGCDAGEKHAIPAESETPVVHVGRENVVIVRRDHIVVGPFVSGQLSAERDATVRAELTGPMAQVAVAEGQTVRRGALLGRIEARELQDIRRSAESSVRSAENHLQVARREADRAQVLVDAGALATRDLDVARSNVASAEAQLADARARLVSAETQLADAVLRSPIDGVVSDRAVNPGDVVSPGTALFTIIDPSSMRLEASVPSNSLEAIRIGAPVRFTVRGYRELFEGRIERINPQADAVTRQVAIYVTVPNVAGRTVAGLFAEGQVVSEGAEGLVVPANAVNTTGDAPWVLRVKHDKAERATVTLGLRDPQTERVLITEGVNEGDILLRGPAQATVPGTPVRVESPPAAADGPHDVSRHAPPPQERSASLRTVEHPLQ